MHCTAEHIAKQVGCSVATVSRVLNNSAPVSAKARLAVLDAVNAAGALPRVRGKRAASKRTSNRNADLPAKGDLVEILMALRYHRPNISVDGHGAVALDAEPPLPTERFFSTAGRYANSFYRHIVDGAIAELKRCNRRAVLQVTDSLTSPSLLEEVNRSSNFGLIILGDYFDETELFLRKVTCPVVSLVTWDHQGWPDYVGIDNYLGIKLAFEHVYKLGHRKIGYLAGTQNIAVLRERTTAYQLCMLRAGLPLRPEWLACAHSDMGGMEQDAQRVLSLEDRPTAFLCFYDGAALAVKRAADRLNLRVPQDLSVVGFDDEEIGQLFSPPLTSIRVPVAQMGRLAVQTLFTRSKMRPGDREHACSMRVMPTLIARESTAAAPAIVRPASEIAS